MIKIAQGAEAIIHKDNNKVIKERFSKKYRLPQIDDSLRKFRTRREAKVLRKLEEMKFPAPALLDFCDKRMQITMDFVPGEKLRDVLAKGDDYQQFAEEIGKKHWLEATPQNILHVDILGKIFPEAYFINVVRHPVGVFYSWKGRSWGPSDITRLSAYLHEGYKKMKDMEDYAQKNGVNLKVFKLEDLCQSYILHSVTDFLGVDRIKTSREVFDISRVDYWKQGIDRSEMDIVQEVFSEFIERYDYSKV